MTRLLILIPKVIGLVLVRPTASVMSGILLILCKRRFTDDIPPLNCMVRLCLCQLIPSAHFREFSRCVELQRAIGYLGKRIGVLTYVIACLTDLCASVSDRDGGRAHGLPGLHQHRQCDFIAILTFYLDQAVFA